MHSIKDYFQIGFKISWAGNYFHAQELISHYVNFPHRNLKVKVGNEIENLDQATQETVDNVIWVQQQAERNKIMMMPLPKYPEAYFSWSRMAFTGFAERLGEDSPENIGIQIGYHTGEILASLRVMSVVLHFSTAVVGVPAFAEQWKNLVQEMSRALKKLNTAAYMAILTPKGPEKLYHDFFVPICPMVSEVLEAEIDFTSEAYLFLLLSRIQSVINDVKSLYETVVEQLGDDTAQNPFSALG
jgi:hypothetical protein